MRPALDQATCSSYGALRPTFDVVPAKAGTHNHKSLFVRDDGTTNPFDNNRRGVWVPTFAGTTMW